MAEHNYSIINASHETSSSNVDTNNIIVHGELQEDLIEYEPIYDFNTIESSNNGQSNNELQEELIEYETIYDFDALERNQISDEIIVCDENQVINKGSIC